MNIIAIYPGTFDPLTTGHRDVIERASRLFTRVILAVADTPDKQTMFTSDERVALAHKVLSGMDNIEVCGFNKLATDLAREKNANVIIRGLRAVSDFDYEFQMAGMNRQLFKDAETIFLTPAEHLSYLSSSLVKEVARLGGDISRFVDPVVLEAVHKKLGK